ncbi:hypothetical protein D1007_44108 [Hordeum vulgare]|uniref:Uncharacterized protein n=1 Tax=Hordeum vulgare subsp. vulgare TaxID=112509 RepID=A0A8I6YAZ7_HORVV|nr:hypothetical protein D1007_44108 [Hordeum vulgare]KAI4995560.1 hypothetical protein ZWY2020_035463 [Hordeum vulgare]
MAASMRSQLKLLVSQGKRPWSYPIITSSLSSTTRFPRHKNRDPPAEQAEDTHAVQQPTPAPAVSDLKHIGHDGAVEHAGKPKLDSSTSFPPHKIHDPVGGYSFHEVS